MGATCRHSIIPTLLPRWRSHGLVYQAEHGRYRVKRDHRGLVRE
jgi:hypothetical protein